MSETNKPSTKLKFIQNLFYSAASIALSVGFMQFVLLPLIAANMPAEEYGFMLTVIAIVDVFAVTFGGTLCNIRLIKREKYASRFFGDYNILALCYCVLACVLSLVVSFFYGEQSILALMLIGLYSVVLFYNSYSAVFFRLKRKFNLELLSAGLMIVGYLLGFVAFKITRIWQFIYILGYSFGFLLSGIIYGKIFKEPMEKTVLYKETSKDVLQLNASSFLKELVTYTDKLVLFQLMGGITVAIYNSAAIVGKCVSLITNPINGLLLSHLSGDNRKNKKYLNYGWIIAIVVSVISFFVFYLISRPLLMLLYPQYCDEAMKIIPLTLIAAMVNAMVAMINPFILKSLSPIIQLFMNSSSLVVYLIAAWLFFLLWGLKGFCFAVILAGLIKLGFLAFCTVRFSQMTGGN